jgi:hypothetical protein
MIFSWEVAVFIHLEASPCTSIRKPNFTLCLCLNKIFYINADRNWPLPTPAHLEI